jgi:sugar lactone lactonase YvrE
MTRSPRELALLVLSSTVACGEPNASSLGRFGREANFPLYYLVSGDSASSGAIYRVAEVAAGETAASELVVDGLTSPSGLAEDSAGNLFVTETLPGPDGSVKRIAAGTTTPRPLILDLSYPTGIAVDSFNQIYVLENGRDRVLRLSAHGRLETLVDSGIGSPETGTMDLNDNLFISEAESTAITMVHPDGALEAVAPDVATGINGIAVDSSGRLHVLVVDIAAQTGRILCAETPGVYVEVATDLVNPTAIAFDSANALYVAEGAPANRISRIVAGETTRRAVVEADGEPVAIAFTPF